MFLSFTSEVFFTLDTWENNSKTHSVIGSFWKSGLSTHKVAGNRENSVGRYFKKFKKFYWTHQSSSFRRISFLALWRSQMGPVLDVSRVGTAKLTLFPTLLLLAQKLDFLMFPFVLPLIITIRLRHMLK